MRSQSGWPDELDERGVSVLLDDRDASPGVKFADAELVGAPVRVTVGKRTVESGTVDVQVRRGRTQSTATVAEVADTVSGLVQ